MPRLSPISALKLLKILNKLGFQILRQKGSHIILKHRDGREVVVPMHKGEDIGRGLLRKILRDLRISPEQFELLR